MLVKTLFIYIALLGFANGAVIRKTKHDGTMSPGKGTKSPGKGTKNEGPAPAPSPMGPSPMGPGGSIGVVRPSCPSGCQLDLGAANEYILCLDLNALIAVYSRSDGTGPSLTVTPSGTMQSCLKTGSTTPTLATESEFNACFADAALGGVIPAPCT